MILDKQKARLRSLALTTPARAKSYAPSYEKLDSEELKYCLTLPVSKRMKIFLREYFVDALERENA